MKLPNFKKFLLVAGFLMLGFAAAKAAIVNAASGSYADVSLAVARASQGDTVLIPPGTNFWTQTLTISGITLQGSGINSTVIRDETPIPPYGNGTTLLSLNVVGSALTRVTQLQLENGVINNVGSNPNNYAGNVTVAGGTPNWRIDHVEFNGLTGKNIMVNDDAYGLIDHNIFLTHGRISVEVHGNGFGDADWAAPAQFGSANAVYVEDNYQSDDYNFGAVDISQGGHCVYRHNTMIGGYFNTHGTETGQRFRGVRYIEIYNNNFTYGGGQEYNNFYTAVDVRGGGAVIFSNTAVGFYTMAIMDCFRSMDNDSSFTPWFGATGERAWDSNGPVLLSGYVTVATNVLFLSIPGSNWTPNQWVGCTVYNFSNQLCGVVSANTGDTMTFGASRNSWLQVKFGVGDYFEIHRIFPMIDQPGIGQGNLLSGDSPSPQFLNQQSDPIYTWSNNVSIMYGTLWPGPGGAATSYPNIVQGRDFINAVARPNYVPYTYPHPLTLMDSNQVVSVPSTNFTSTNLPTLAPPTDLNAHGL